MQHKSPIDTELLVALQATAHSQVRNVDEYRYFSNIEYSSTAIYPLNDQLVGTMRRLGHLVCSSKV